MCSHESLGQRFGGFHQPRVGARAFHLVVPTNLQTSRTHEPGVTGCVVGCVAGAALPDAYRMKFVMSCVAVAGS